MNKKKKILTGMFLLFLAWILGSGIVLADDSGSCTITIQNLTGGYVYEAYQIFAGTYYKDPDTSEKILSDITWGNGITEDGIAAMQEAYGASSAAELAGILSGDEKKAEEFASLAGEFLTEPAGQADTCSSGGYVITVQECGYYLVKNSKVPEEEGAYTSYILQVAGNVKVNPKSDWPSCDKKVEEKNDSGGEAPSAGTTADHRIGDAVNFTLTATLPGNYEDYGTYSLYFHDTLSDGLTFQAKSVRVSVSTPGSGTYAVDESSYRIASADGGKPAGDTCTFEVQFSDLNSLTAAGDGSRIPVHKDSVITVTYSAVLNEKAVIGNPGNPNKLYIGYSDNPYESDSMNKTPTHEVVVFTYELVIKKVDEKKEPLPGAAFELYQYHAAGRRWEKISGQPEVSQDGTRFTFTGLDAGRYKLTESTAPGGYNRMEDLYFTVEAVQKEDTSSETGFSVELHTTVTDQKGNPLSGAGDIFQVGQDGNIETDVVNRKGSILPGTGGAGAVLFYAVGFLLLAAAAFLFFRIRRGERLEKLEKKD